MNFEQMAREQEQVLARIERVRRDKGLSLDCAGTFFAGEVEAIRTRISLYRMLAEPTAPEREQIANRAAIQRELTPNGSSIRARASGGQHD